MPRQTSKTVSIATSDDSYTESAETMALNLSSPSGGTIADGSATGTINDNDNASVTFAISDAGVVRLTSPQRGSP